MGWRALHLSPWLGLALGKQVGCWVPHGEQDARITRGSSLFGFRAASCFPSCTTFCANGSFCNLLSPYNLIVTLTTVPNLTHDLTGG